MNIKPWIAAFRLKTLPLALSNTIIGTSLAAADNRLKLVNIWTDSTYNRAFTNSVEYGQRLR